MKYYLSQLKDYQLLNYRVHDIWRKLLNDPNVEKFPCIKSTDVTAFIVANQHDPNKTLLVYHYEHTNNYILELIQHLNSYKELQLRVVFFTFDYWDRGRGDKPYHNIWNIIYLAKNHHVITFAPNFKNLQFFHNANILPYRDHIHHFNLWCCYEKSFMPFNETPRCEIAVSGEIAAPFYPERRQILKQKGCG